MLPSETAIPVLTRDEAEIIAADLLNIWQGITGLKSTPTLEAAADLVQRVWRKGGEIVEGRYD